MPIPFYIIWEKYIEFVNLTFPSLTLTDDSLFLGFIILNCMLIICIFILIKIVKFFVLLGKNLIFR